MRTDNNIILGLWLSLVMIIAMSIFFIRTPQRAMAQETIRYATNLTILPQNFTAPYVLLQQNIPRTPYFIRIDPAIVPELDLHRSINAQTILLPEYIIESQGFPENSRLVITVDNNVCGFGERINRSTGNNSLTGVICASAITGFNSLTQGCINCRPSRRKPIDNSGIYFFGIQGWLLNFDEDGNREPSPNDFTEITDEGTRQSRSQDWRNHSETWTVPTNSRYNLERRRDCPISTTNHYLFTTPTRIQPESCSQYTTYNTPYVNGVLNIGDGFEFRNGFASELKNVITRVAIYDNATGTEIKNWNGGTVFITPTIDPTLVDPEGNTIFVLPDSDVLDNLSPDLRTEITGITDGVEFESPLVEEQARNIFERLFLPRGSTIERLNALFEDSQRRLPFGFAILIYDSVKTGETARENDEGYEIALRSGTFEGGKFTILDTQEVDFNTSRYNTIFNGIEIIILSLLFGGTAWVYFRRGFLSLG